MEVEIHDDTEDPLDFFAIDGGSVEAGGMVDLGVEYGDVVALWKVHMIWEKCKILFRKMNLRWEFNIKK